MNKFKGTGWTDRQTERNTGQDSARQDMTGQGSPLEGSIWLEQNMLMPKQSFSSHIKYIKATKGVCRCNPSRPRACEASGRVECEHGSKVLNPSP